MGWSLPHVVSFCLYAIYADAVVVPLEASARNRRTALYTDAECDRLRSLCVGLITPAIVLQALGVVARQGARVSMPSFGLRTSWEQVS